jgi:hypothetical protein
MVMQRFTAAIRQLLPQARAMPGAIMEDFRILFRQLPIPFNGVMTLCVAESRGKDI